MTCAQVATHRGGSGESGTVVPALRELDAGTWYDVTAMEKENYLVRDLDSEDRCRPNP